MIKTNSGRATVFLYVDEVHKEYYDMLMYLKEKFAYETFPELCAKLIRIEGRNIITVPGTSLRDWLKEEHTKKEKEDIKNKIILLLRKLHDKGYVHCDVHIDNIIIYFPDDVRLIDFEHLRCRSRDKFEEDIDIKGGNYICAFDNSPRSIKINLGDFE